MGCKIKGAMVALMWVGVVTGLPGQAAESDATVNSGMPASAAESTAALAALSQGQPLEGTVNKVELSLESLRDVGLDLKEVMAASRHLYDEVTIQPLTLITQPSMVGAGTIVNIPIGTMPSGPLQPPRKERVDLAMKNMAPIISMFKQNADAFVTEEKQLAVSPEAQSKLNPLVQEWISNVNQIYKQLQELLPLTQGPAYDNAAIASICREMQTTAKDLDKIRSRAFKIIKNDPRR